MGMAMRAIGIVLCFLALSIVESMQPPLHHHITSLGSDASALTVTLDTNTGAYTINLNNKVWFTSTYYKIHVNNKWYTTQDGSLKLASNTRNSGTDVLGAYNEVALTWNAGSVPFVTSFKTYAARPNVVVFAQEFPQGANGTTVGSQDQPLTAFPNFNIKSSSLGFLHFSDDMAGARFQTGLFPKNYIGAYVGGPVGFFDADLNTVVMSSLTYFLSVVTNTDPANGNALYTGVQGKVLSIPANFKFEYVMYGGQGVQSSFMGWGDVLLAKYEKTRVIPTASLVLAYLGYSTTGYYFYSPLDYNASSGNYEETLLEFNRYSLKLGIPYRYYLLDSWWYGEYSIYGGVWKWEDSPEFLKYRFPHGLQYLHRQLGVPFAAHIGKWVSSTPYAQNKDYGFVVEKNWAIPTRVELYDFIFQNASQWGLNTLKQDHINEQILDMNITLADVTTARDWLLAEGKGASHHGINIEYCMDWTTVLLTSLENPTATHSRAGGDYVPKEAETQWTIGVTSIFLWAIGLYPDKDTFFTTTTEVTKNPLSDFYNFQEQYPLLHAMASSMSAGPITPSDGIGGSDKDIIMSMCAADGLLLKPDRPAINIDSTWIQRSFGGSIGPNGDVITSYTSIGPNSWHFIFSANLKTSYDFLTTDLLVGLPGQALVVVYNQSQGGFVSTPQPFGVGQNLKIPIGNRADPFLWVVAPLLDNGWYYIGETNKFISVSKQRTVSLETTLSTLTVEIAGQAGEVVSLSFVAPTSLTKVNTYKCTIGPSGRSLFVLPGAACYAS